MGIRLIAAVAVLAAGLAACGQGPGKGQVLFVSACVDKGDTREACRCAYDEVAANMTPTQLDLLVRYMTTPEAEKEALARSIPPAEAVGALVAFAAASTKAKDDCGLTQPIWTQE